MKATLTDHAKKRVSQRGVQGETIQTVILFGDRQANLCVVVANDNDAVVTVVSPSDKKAAHSYSKYRGYGPRSRNQRRR